jgi:amidase
MLHTKVRCAGIIDFQGERPSGENFFAHFSATSGEAGLTCFGPPLTMPTTEETALSRKTRGNEARTSRREFMQTTLVGAVSGAVLPALAGAQSVQHEPGRAAAVVPFEFAEMTIPELQASIASGKYTTHSLVQRYLERIEALDKQGPAVNAIIELNPDALGIADAQDKQRQARKPGGILQGVPILVKDNLDTRDKMMTTAGSLALVGARPPKDSMVVQKLRAAGAVIIGKTNLSEWANIRSSHSTSGWSGRGGLTKNPYALDRNACGSSSGSGVAVSANFCAAAIGTETDGSIVCPAHANGIVGIKPTVGLVSRAGIVPISHSQDGAGPMARTVADAALLLSVIAGTDPDDPATASIANKRPIDYRQYLDPKGLRGARIGVARKYFGFSEPVDALMENVLAAMRSEGAILVDPADIESFGKFGDTELLVFMYELKADLNAYLAKLGDSSRVHSLKDVIEFNEKNKDKEMPWFGQDLLIKAESKGPLTDKAYVEALEKNHLLARAQGIEGLMDKNKLDAIVAPTAGPSCVTDLLNGDHFTGGSSDAAAVAGYPNINVPAGFIGGMPVGISFFGRAWSEPTLIKVAYAFEQAVKARKPPQFLPTLDVNPNARS